MNDNRWIKPISWLVVLAAMLSVWSWTRPRAETGVQELTAGLPSGTTLDHLNLDGPKVTIYLTLPDDALRPHQLTYAESDEITARLASALSQHYPHLRHFHIVIKDPADGLYKPISSFLPALPPIPEKPYDGSRPQTKRQPPAFGQAQPVGALTGKTIFLSQSHGWYWHSQLGWISQRPNTNEVVEDFINAEAINQYLVQYLWNAGADVWTCRERDLNPHEMIVDNDQPEGYTETGSWQTGALPGYGGSYRWAITSSDETARATWHFNVPEDGHYAVYVWYLAGGNRATTVRFEINHAGAATVVAVNQEVHGSTWRYLGTYYFRAGREGAIILSNASTEPGEVVIADAIRLGGGLGSIARGGVTSRKPRWEEAARYFAEYQGAPPSVYDPLSTGEDNSDDVTARPRYSEWEKEPGEDAVYISLHTNAPFPGSGTESYIHNTTPSPGSALLQNSVHREIINDIRQGWDPNWVDRGLKSANFGEVRLLSTMPGVLIELAFHDTPTPDALYLKEPNFRRLAARAIYQGIVTYFERRDQIDLTLLPEPPTHLAVRNTGPGEVTLSWHPPLTDAVNLAGEGATSYKVYTSLDGKAFDNGRVTSDTSLLLSDMTPGQVYYFRLTALNEGGESFPTETLAVRVSEIGSRPSVLLVNGFDRLDRFALIPKNEGGALGVVKRMFLERMNTYDYIIEHAVAIDAYGAAFDSCSNEAVRDGGVDLLEYSAVDWILGEESTVDETFDAREQGLVQQYLTDGGNLFVSGAEIAWDLDQRGGLADRLFYQGFLNAQCVGDDAETYTVSGAGGIFADLGPFTIDNGSRRYDVDFPDQLLPISPAIVSLVYIGGNGGNAAIEFSGSYKVVNLGFPFEALVDADARQAVMARVLTLFGIIPSAV